MGQLDTEGRAVSKDSEDNIMANLSAIVRQRQGIIIQWCVNQIGSLMFVELHGHDEDLMRRRLQMMTAITLVPTDNNGIHLLDDDANWQLLRREMKIDSGQFFTHMRTTTAWGRVVNSSNHDPNVPTMTERFYRSRLVHKGDSYQIEPELVEGFPSIAPYTLGVCREQWGLTGSKPELSGNTALKKLTMVLNLNEYEVDIVAGQTQYYWSPGATIDQVNVKAEPADSTARVNIIDGGLFTGLEDKDVTITVTAEDDSQQVYTFTFRSSASEDAMQIDTSIHVLEVSLPDGTILPFTQEFDSTILTYILPLSDGISEVLYNVVPGFSGATVTLPSTSVNVGLIIKPFLVTSADGNHQESYNVLFVRNA